MYETFRKKIEAFIQEFENIVRAMDKMHGEIRETQRALHTALTEKDLAISRLYMASSVRCQPQKTGDSHNFF